MRIDGGCHCGRVTYEAEIDERLVGICHCTDCQVFTGSAYSISVPAPKDAFRIRGETKTDVKTADSGRQRLHAFCPECGTRIYAAAPADPKTFNIRLGTIRQRAALRPVVQVWCRSALPWAMELGAVPKIEGQPGR
jgi:hypothetical protein